MNGPELNLNSANAAAAEYLRAARTEATADPVNDTSTDTPSAPSTPEPVSAATVETPAPVPSTPPAINIDEFVDVEIEPGKTIKVHKDGKDGYLRLADYTRKTQEVARTRKEAETLYEQLQREAAEFREFLNNPTAVAQFVAEMQKQSQQTPTTPPAPDDLVAARDLETFRERIEREMTEKMQATVTEVENKRQVEAMRSDFDRTVSDVLAKHSILLKYHDVEEIGQLLKLDAGKAKPQTTEDAKKAIIAAAEARANKLTSHVESLRQQEAIEKAKSLKSIEPPGGGAPQPVPTQFKLGDKGLQEAAIRYLQQQKRR